MIKISLLLYTVFTCVAAEKSPDLLPDLVEKVGPGVVNISSSRYVKQYVLRGIPEFFGTIGIPEARVQKQSALGTGFVIDEDGYILTNNHVIENASEVIVNFQDKRNLPAKIIGRDKALDLALLQLRGGRAVGGLKPLKLGESDKTRIGETVFAIGNPFGLQHTVTKGIISAKNRTIGVGPYDNFLQTDASINFGNSGGPLFNLQGEVIGINTAINANGQGLGFAIPIDEAKINLHDLKTLGHIARVWLGVLGEKVTPAAQYYYSIPAEKGVLIDKLSSQGPALKAGLRARDVLTKIENQEILDVSDAQRVLSKLKPNQEINITFNRLGKIISKKVVVKLAPRESEDLPDGVF